MKSDQPLMGIRFLGIVSIFYAIAAFIQPTAVIPALHTTLSLLTKIFPAMAAVFVLMVITNLSITPQMITKYVGKSSGYKRWVAAIVGGIISTGPIYLWYALLKEFINKGMSKGVIAAFLYARAIKPFILPLMIYYFGWKYVVVLTVIMIFFSLVQGFIVEKLMKK